MVGFHAKGNINALVGWGIGCSREWVVSIGKRHHRKTEPAIDFWQAAEESFAGLGGGETDNETIIVRCPWSDDDDLDEDS